MNFNKNFKLFLATFYFLLLFYVVFFLSERMEKDFNGIINCIPFRKVIFFFEDPDSYESVKLLSFLIELFGNIVLLMPFSFALKQLFNKQYVLKKFLSIVLFTSVFIEFIQYLFNIGVADIDDVILNTVGGFVGYLITRSQTNIFPTYITKNNLRGYKDLKQ